MKFALLSLLYVIEGLPFGFQAQALPLYLYDAGFSKTAIGFLGVLSAPWLAKPLWAPLVDRWGSARIGRRKSWILPMQLGMVATCLGAALVPKGHGLGVMLGLVFLMNLFAATLDIAVDGLAVDLLGPSELGGGNAAQVAGYKVGMFAGGFALAAAARPYGWAGLFGAMAALVAVAFAVMLLWREPPAATTPRERTSIAAIVEAAFRAVATVDGAWLLLCVATYKFGESLIDPMFKLFVRDAGFSTQQVLRWNVGYGMVASILGSVAGGLFAMRVPVLRALVIAAAIRVVPLAAEWWVATHGASAPVVVPVIVAEHFFGGALTTVMFAMMMARVDKRIGATHYTVLAAIEVLGKMPAGLLSGWLADHAGYGATFAAGTLLSVAYLPLLGKLRDRRS